MNESKHQVLVDPWFASESRDLIDFLGEFGPFNGRYVPRYPSDWTSRLRKHIEDLSIKDPVKRQAMLERLRREAPLCTVPVGWKWKDGQTWRNNVKECLPQHAQPLIVGDAYDPEPFKAWVDALEEIRETRKRTWPFHGAISEFVESCLPLLLNSPAAYLIDPYLDLFSDMGEMLLRTLLDASKGSKCYSIQIITRRGACGSYGRANDASYMSDSDISSSLRQIYKNILPKDRELLLHLVSDSVPGEHGLRMHDRFFLTIHGAINFGQGFFMLKQPLPQQNAFVLDKEHHAVLKQTYIDGVTRYAERLPKVPKIPYPKGVNSFAVKAD